MPRVEACDQGSVCRNSIQLRGDALAMCRMCRLAPGNEEFPGHYWRPIQAHAQHPVLRQEKIDKARAKQQANIQKRMNRDRGRMKVQRQAVHAEKSTERKIIQATKNSGRVNRDGDHKAGGFITLDTKNQSLRDNPVVQMAELAKVRGDAVNAGNQIGGLVLRNRHNVGVVVFDEKDFARVFLGGDSGNGNQ